MKTFLHLLPYLALGIAFVIELVLIYTEQARMDRREQEKTCKRRP